MIVTEIYTKFTVFFLREQIRSKTHNPRKIIRKPWDKFQWDVSHKGADHNSSKLLISSKLRKIWETITAKRKLRRYNDYRDIWQNLKKKKKRKLKVGILSRSSQVWLWPDSSALGGNGAGCSDYGPPTLRNLNGFSTQLWPFQVCGK